MMSFHRPCILLLLHATLSLQTISALSTGLARSPSSFIRETSPLHRRLFAGAAKQPNFASSTKPFDSALASSSTTAGLASSRNPQGFTDDAIYRPVFESGLRYRKDDWWTNLLNLPSSYVLRRIWPHLAVNVVISIVVTIVYKLSWWPAISIPMLGHNLLGGFLGLLLVFRQNTAYSRFWDARCVWSQVAAKTRTMALEIVTHIRPKAPNSAKRLLTLVAAFPDALAYSCLGKIYPLAHNVKKLVLPRVARTTTKVAPATILCMMIQEELHNTENEMKKRELLENLHILEISHAVGSLASYLKACERILNSPVPWSYSRHTSRFLTIYTATLPLAVVSTLGWLTVPVMTVLCWCLFGIEEIVSHTVHCIKVIVELYA